jgi:hypothetical protein
MRTAAEAFIRSIYRERYGAQIAVEYPWLLAFEDAAAELRAAVGLRCGEHGALFVERYLQEPAERRLQRPGQDVVRRADLIEFGNFAAHDAGDSRALILSLISLLQGTGKRWVLFVATRQLRNAFARLGLPVQALGAADPAALGEDAARWGSYYASMPVLCAGDLSQVETLAMTPASTLCRGGLRVAEVLP